MASGAHADRSAGEAMDDTTVATNVKLQLIDDEVAPAGDINVESYKGVVQLIGFVQSQEEKDAAIARAKQVEGTKAVYDALIVMPGHRSFGRTVDDQTIYGKVWLELAQVEGMSEAVAVVVKVRNGEVLLGGFVDNKDTVRAVGTAAKGVEGVTKVHNAVAAKP
jgi:hyperosmotically inducible protein